VIEFALALVLGRNLGTDGAEPRRKDAAGLGVDFRFSNRSIGANCPS